MDESTSRYVNFMVFFLSFDAQDCERRHMAKLFRHRLDEKRTRQKATE